MNNEPTPGGQVSDLWPEGFSTPQPDQPRNTEGEQQEQTAPPPPSQPAQPAQPPAAEPRPPLTGGSMYTMPEKFMAGAHPTTEPKAVKPVSGKRLIAVVIIIAVILAGITAGAYYYLHSPFNPFLPRNANTPTNQPGVTNQTPNTNQPAGNTNDTGNTNIPPADMEAAQARDAQRLNDITGIAAALDSYYEQYGSYPQFLSLVPSEILSTIPRDPLTNAPYTYVANRTRQSYEVVFDVEQSVVFKGETLVAGTYKLTPADFKESTNANENTNTSPPDDGTERPGNFDSDGDGLTEYEERLFTTSPDRNDTDSDGYRDADEVKNFYSPIQSGAVRLNDAGLVSQYENETYSYSFYYPTGWVTSTVGGNAAEVLITSTTGENFSITVRENPSQKTSWEWYVENVSGDYNRASVDFITVSGREAVRTADGLQVYVAAGSYLYTITYSLNDQTTLNYPNVFDLLISRFSIVLPS